MCVIGTIENILHVGENNTNGLGRTAAQLTGRKAWCIRVFFYQAINALKSFRCHPAACLWMKRTRDRGNRNARLFSHIFDIKLLFHTPAFGLM